MVCGCILAECHVPFFCHCDIDFVSTIILSGIYPILFRANIPIRWVFASWHDRVIHVCTSVWVTVSLTLT